MSNPAPSPAQAEVPLVMIVEDQSITAFDLQSWLRAGDLACVTALATSGEEALAMAASVGADAAVMDIKLAGSMDGVETARRLWQGYRVPSVFVTGLPEASIGKRLEALEHAGLLRKPLDKTALFICLQRALEIRRQWLAREAERQSVLRFFVVGDEDGAIRSRLEALGHEVVADRHWEPMADAVSRSNVAEDVLLVDRPDASGASLIPDLRSLHRRCPRVPIVVRVAGAALPMPMAALCGVHGYLRNPLDLAELELVVLRLQDRRVNESLLDSASGLYRRAGFAALARQQLRSARRTGTQVSLLRADLGNSVADMTEMDSRLGRLGTIVQSTFRDADIAGRIDGTDCGVLLLNADRETTQIALSRLRRQIEEYNEGAEPGSRIDVEVGLAHFDPAKPCSFEELVASTLSQHS